MTTKKSTIDAQQARQAMMRVSSTIRSFPRKRKPDGSGNQLIAGIGNAASHLHRTLATGKVLFADGTEVFLTNFSPWRVRQDPINGKPDIHESNFWLDQWQNFTTDEGAIGELLRFASFILLSQARSGLFPSSERVQATSLLRGTLWQVVKNAIPAVERIVLTDNPKWAQFEELDVPYSMVSEILDYSAKLADSLKESTRGHASTVNVEFVL